MTKYVAPEVPEKYDGRPLEAAAWLRGHWRGMHDAHMGTSGEVFGPIEYVGGIVNPVSNALHCGFDRGVYDFDQEYADDENDITYGCDVEWEN